jgi:hypothetical protein
MFLRPRPLWIFLKSGGSSENTAALLWPITSKVSFEKSFFSSPPHRKLDIAAATSTEHNVKFFPVYSYLIVYRPQTNPLQVVSILHGRRDVVQILKDRL